jgi:hypothetical protein
MFFSMEPVQGCNKECLYSTHNWPEFCIHTALLVFSLRDMLHIHHSWFLCTCTCVYVCVCVCARACERVCWLTPGTKYTSARHVMNTVLPICARHTHAACTHISTWRPSLHTSLSVPCTRHTRLSKAYTSLQGTHASPYLVQGSHVSAPSQRRSEQHTLCRPLQQPRLVRLHICRVGQNRICTPYMTACMVNSLPKVLCIHRVYICMYGFGKSCKYDGAKGWETSQCVRCLGCPMWGWSAYRAAY